MIFSHLFPAENTGRAARQPATVVAVETVAQFPELLMTHLTSPVRQQVSQSKLLLFQNYIKHPDRNLFPRGGSGR